MEQVKSLPYAVVFPGQGSQEIGMGCDITNHFFSAREIYLKAEEITQLPIQELCFNGPEENLIRTENTQPCLLATSIALYTVFQEKFPIPPRFLCGHSAGEYAALAVAGVILVEDALHLIQARGKFMSQMENGGMLAVKGLTPEEIYSLCSKAVVPEGTLVPANWNTPEQVIISGDLESIDSAILLCIDQDIPIVPLAVSGAFHSPLMEEAAKRFAVESQNVEFQFAKIPVISNVTGMPVQKRKQWRSLLEQQITSPVLWEQTVNYIAQQGIKFFIEIGSGHVLSRLIQKTIPSAMTFNVSDVSSLESTVMALKEEFMTVRAG